MQLQRFPKVKGLSKGYAIGQVDAFFSRALGDGLSAAQVRSVGFDLVRGGYDVEPVDDALDRLEDELSRKERDHDRATLGERGVWDRASNQAQALRARVGRPHGDRFPRGTALTPSYDVGQVDELCDRIADYFDGAEAMTVGDVRQAVFSRKRGGSGYREESVDRFLDRVVEVMSQVV